MLYLDNSGFTQGGECSYPYFWNDKLLSALTDVSAKDVI